MEEKDSDLIQEYYLVYTRPYGKPNDRYNLVKAYSPREAIEKMKNELIKEFRDPTNYFIEVQKTII